MPSALNNSLGEKYTFKITFSSKSKQESELVSFFVSGNVGYCLVHGKRQCAWDSRTRLALLMDNLTAPLLPEQPEPRPEIVSEAPNVTTIICDQLLLEVEKMVSPGSSANAVRQALCGSWRKAGSPYDLPPMKQEMAIRSVLRPSLPVIPFDRLILSSKPFDSTPYVTVQLVSHYLHVRIVDEMFIPRKRAEGPYNEYMLNILGFNAGELLPIPGNKSDQKRLPGR